MLNVVMLNVVALKNMLVKYHLFLYIFYFYRVCMEVVYKKSKIIELINAMIAQSDRMPNA
jgi:hypothetical protein